MNMVNIVTQSTVLPTQIDGTFNPGRALLLAHGWRDMPELPPVADGYERGPVVYVDGADGEMAVAVYEDTLISDRLAREQAADAERRNTPLVFDRPIETPAIVLTSNDGGLGIAQAAFDDGTIVTFTYHASPIPEPAEIRRRMTEAKAAHDARKAAVAQAGNKSKQSIGAAQNVPALRAAVLELQAQIDAINARLG